MKSPTPEAQYAEGVFQIQSPVSLSKNPLKYSP